MPKNVIIVSASARIDKKETATNGDPVLLSVVVSKWLAIVKLPLTDRIETDAIRSRCHKGRVIGTQGEKKPIFKFR